MFRRVLDAVVLALVAFTGANSLRESPVILLREPLATWRGVVGVGQVLVGVGAAVMLVGYWRRRVWLRSGALTWAIGGLIAGPIATFAWGEFDRVAFFSAIVAMGLVATGVVRWSVLRARRPSSEAMTSTSTA